MTYRKRSSDEIQTDIEQLESMLAGLRAELEYAKQREAMERGSIDGIIESLKMERANIMRRVAELGELIAAEKARRES